MEFECFVHGAQCVAESGRCFMSHDAFGKSACRGECVQPCRRRFVVKAVDFHSDADGNPVHESDTEFVVEPRTILSAKDLCSLAFLGDLAAAGVTSFKIEGRARNPEYVKVVTAAYREAVDALCVGRLDETLVERLERDVRKVFNRRFSRGMYFGRPGEGQFTDCENSAATTVKRHVGVVADYFRKAGMVQVKVQDAPVSVGDTVQIHGATTGVLDVVVGEMRRDDESIRRAERGTWATFAAPRCRVGDKVFLVEARDPSRPKAREGGLCP